MPGDFSYVLDANVFIEASRRYYAFDIAPRFWEILLDRAGAGVIKSIDRVKRELEKGKDDLASWARSAFSDYFASTDVTDILESYREIINWAQAQSQYSDSAKAEFANSPDGWLVAYAKAKGAIVVTHEVLDPGIRRKIPIPNICQAFRISYIDTFQMLRAFGMQFT